MPISLTFRPRRWVTGLLDHIHQQRVYETPDYESYLDHNDTITVITARMDWLYKQTPALVALGPWVVDQDGVQWRLWELTDAGLNALAKALVASAGVR